MNKKSKYFIGIISCIKRSTMNCGIDNLPKVTDSKILCVLNKIK